jgi:hypothetical protein
MVLIWFLRPSNYSPLDTIPLSYFMQSSVKSCNLWTILCDIYIIFFSFIPLNTNTSTSEAMFARNFLWHELGSAAKNFAISSRENEFTNFAGLQDNIRETSVADPWHFGIRIRIRFSLVTFKMTTKKIFSKVFLPFTFRSYIYIIFQRQKAIKKSQNSRN